MKTADLTPGEDYLVSYANDWLTSGRGISRYRVIDTGRWSLGARLGREDWKFEALGQTWTVPGYIVQNPTGRARGVLAASVGADGSIGSPMVIEAREIRGPWDEANRLRKQKERERVAQQQERQRARDEMRSRKRGVLDALGIVEGSPYDRDSVIVLNLADGERLVEILEQYDVQFPIFNIDQE